MPKNRVFGRSGGVEFKISFLIRHQGAQTNLTALRLNGKIDTGKERGEDEEETSHRD